MENKTIFVDGDSSEINLRILFRLILKTETILVCDVICTNM